MTTLTIQDKKLLHILQRYGPPPIAGGTGRNVALTLLEPKKLDLNARIYMHVSLLDHAEETIDILNHFVQAEPQIIEVAPSRGRMITCSR